MKKKRFMDELMAEVIRYGGLPVRRCDAYFDALARLRTHEGATEAQCKRWADIFAFGPQTQVLEGVEPISAEELAKLD